MYKILVEESEPYRLVKNEKWNGIILKGEDLLVLQQIYIHSSVRAPSIHELYQMTYGKERNSNWITNRLKKMMDAGLIERMNERLGTKGQVAGLIYYHYRLKERGYEVLHINGLVSKKEALNVHLQSKRKSLPNTHARSASYLANMIFLNSYKHGIEDFFHVRGSRHNYLGIAGNALTTDITGLIVPDWVFERGDVVIAIEVDTGTQRREKILSKYRLYKKVAEFYQSIGKTLIVLFAVVDLSIMDLAVGSDYRSETRHKRIGSLKDLFSLNNEWPENLHIYVATAKRVPKLVSSILCEQEPAKEMKKILDVNTWFDIMSERLPINKEMIVENLDEVLLPNRNRLLDPAHVFQLRQDGFIQERHLVLFGEEGSVRSYQNIRNNAQHAYRYNANPNNVIPLKVDVIFANKESAEEDVYGNDVYDSVYFRDLASLEEGELLQDKQSVYIQKLVSPFRKVEVGM